MDKLTLVHIIPSLGRGGAERFVVDLCNELAKSNEVYLISLFDNTEHSFQHEVSKDVRLISLGKRPGLDLKVIPKLFKLIKKIAPRVVNSHINALEYLIPYMLFRFRNKNIKFFHTIHNEADKEVENRGIFLIRKMLFSSKLITPITISSSMSQSFQKVYNLYGYDKQIDNGRPFKPFDIKKRDEIRAKYRAADGQLYVNVARIDTQKNQLNLVRAFKNLRSTIGNGVLLVLGDVMNETIYRNIIDEVAGEYNIYLLGGVSNVEDYLAASDAFILPSIYEGMPISLIEALSHGCIPICSPVGGMKDMIEDEKNGFFTTGTLVDDIANGIVRYSKNENKEAISENAKKCFHDHYAIESSASNYLKAYTV
ncbi:glycosyltransferase family 4 protein [Sphingobacterium sp. HMA12]|uniref:glycosyltransferase family 4 protein n=1 Tax=Sphingobacterium sp. HMA12 TaxID=2050894 RepID=UPI000CEA2DD3|nr:glycosyltransferase family 4 protein [Sphingobacterium sp. HMA12]